MDMVPFTCDSRRLKCDMHISGLRLRLLSKSAMVILELHYPDMHLALW